jgi:hypothetical protein
MANLFTDNFPDVKSDEELEKVKQQYTIFGYDEYYIASGCLPERREKFNKLWSVYEPYSDRHFLNQFKLKPNFHARTWEMYLGNVFLKNGLQIAPNENHCPDIKIISYNVPVWVEAVVCKKGDKPENAVPEIEYGGSKAKKRPEDQMLLRLTNSLCEKFSKYKGYLSKSVINKNEPFIIAVNSGLLGRPDSVPPLICKCLFSLGDLKVPFSIGESASEPDSSYISTREYLYKKTGSPVSLSFFENEAHSGISAVIYSTITVLNHPKRIGEDCILVHNPKAENPLDRNLFAFIKQQWEMKGDTLEKIK